VFFGAGGGSDGYREGGDRAGSGYDNQMNKQPVDQQGRREMDQQGRGDVVRDQGDGGDSGVQRGGGQQKPQSGERTMNAPRVREGEENDPNKDTEPSMLSKLLGMGHQPNREMSGEVGGNQSHEEPSQPQQTGGARGRDNEDNRPPDRQPQGANGEYPELDNYQREWKEEKGADH